MKVPCLASIALSLALPLSAQVMPPVDPSLMSQINQLRAIDNHAHPSALVNSGEKDDDFDALPCDPLEPTTPGLLFREDNPVYLEAWKSLFGYKYDDAAPEHLRELLAAKQKAKQQQGDNYPDWVLDQLGIERELANRIVLGRGQSPPRFQWVPFDDILLFPLENSALAAQSPDRNIFFAREAMLLQRYLRQLGVDGVPATLPDYEAKIVTPLLELQKKNGAVAIKFEAAYLRSLDFAPAQRADAERIYGSYPKGKVPTNSDYKILQDYLFRYVAREAGRLGLVIHLHTGGGCGGYFYLEGSNPVLLDSVFNDPSLRKTNFVMLHAGAGNFDGLVAYLLMKPNVYADISEQTWMTSAHHMASGLRFMLEWYPEKVLFGTDLFPGLPQVDWEEIGYQTNRNARLALAEALTGMMRDGEITRQRANGIAKMVMRENAMKLYGWNELRTK